MVRDEPWDTEHVEHWRDLTTPDVLADFDLLLAHLLPLATSAVERRRDFAWTAVLPEAGPPPIVKAWTGRATIRSNLDVWAILRDDRDKLRAAGGIWPVYMSPPNAYCLRAELEHREGFAVDLYHVVPNYGEYDEPVDEDVVALVSRRFIWAPPGYRTS